MPHRPSDSRILTSLLANEKEYHKSMLALLDHSSTSLSSFSAYASSSSPPASHAVIAIAEVFASADDAFGKYAEAVDRWQSHIKALKDLEDDVGAVVRDREILVTRLLKASSKTKPSRSDRASVISTSPRESTSTLSLSHGSSKLTVAQAELQACESTLAEKERELDALRLKLVRVGLDERCKALVECARAWGEAGQRGIEIAQGVDLPNGSASRDSSFFKSGEGGPPSETSSVTPSQSASQIASPPGSAVGRSSSPQLTTSTPTTPRRTSTESTGSYTLRIPPAHNISDLAVPSPMPAPVVDHPARRSADRRRLSHVSEIVDEPGTSSGEEDSRDLQVVENDRYKTWGGMTPGPNLGRAPAGGKEAAGASSSTVKLKPDPRPALPHQFSSNSIEQSQSAQRERKPSFTSFFGSLFGGRRRQQAREQDQDEVPPRKGKNASNTGTWRTRTDANLRKGGSRPGGDSSDDEPAKRDKQGKLTAISTSATYPVHSTSSEVGTSGTSRLRKGKKPGHDRRLEEDADKGWASDTAGAERNGSVKRKASQGRKNRVLEDPEATLAASPSTSSPSRTYAPPASPSKRSRSPSASRKGSVKGKDGAQRSQSVDAPRADKSRVSASTLSERRSTLPAAPYGTYAGSTGAKPPGSQSLKDIVEGVAKQNREGWSTSTAPAVPSLPLEIPKAPPPVSLLDLDKVLSSPSSSKQTPAVSRSKSLSSKSDAPSKDRNGVPSSHTKAASATAANPEVHHPIPGLMPRKSALRNGSRSPSPLSGRKSTEAAPRIPAKSPLAPTPTPTVAPPAPAPPANVPNGEAQAGSSSDEDNESVASYATGLEDLPEEGPGEADSGSGSGGSSTSTATATGTETGKDKDGAPKRRKSVRLSLPPTFSQTPPALDSEAYGPEETWDGDRKRKQGGDRTKERKEKERGAGEGRSGGGGWRSRGGESDGGVKDMWEDSTDEDEQYGQAKRLLKRAARKGT